MNETPTVHLPSPAGLNPNLGPLLNMPEYLLRTEGPRAACHQCDYVATGFMNAVENDLDVHTVKDGEPVLVSAADVEMAAGWLLSCMKVLHMCQH